MPDHKFFPSYPQRILIRQDYIYLLHCTEEALENLEYQEAVIIGGQPGIGLCIILAVHRHQLIFYSGKSMLLYYILLKRLNEGKPTYFQKDAAYLYRFDSQGVARIGEDISGALHTEFYWALVDSNAHVTKPAPFIMDSDTHIIYATSPERERVKWTKYIANETNLFMKPWTRVELMQGYVLNIS